MTSKVIAITGGIGSGKSEVVKYLQSLGYATVDCDELAKEVAEYPQIVEQVRLLLGSECVVEGSLNRKIIRDKVFANEHLLRQYNAIFFDKVKNLLDERISSLNNQKYVFVEIAVFDAFDYAWDGVWLVEADREKRIERTVLRDGSQRETIENIMSRQIECSACSVKLINNGDISQLKSQIDRALKAIE